jgi:hypothetical protein
MASQKETKLGKYVQRTFGAAGFTQKGTIKVAVLKDLAKNPQLHKITRQRAILE